jgi:hypothetical protein
MNDEIIPVYPNIKKIVNISSMKIEIMDMTLFQSVTLRVIFFSDENIPVDVKVFVMDKSNGYNQWANDDKYIVTWVQQQLQIGKFA